MAEIALERRGAFGKGEALPLRWYRENPAMARALISFLVVGVVWELAGQSGRWNLMIAPLSKIFESAAKMWNAGQLQKHIAISLNEFAWGFALAAAVGILLGIAIATSDVVRDYLDPWISALYSTPTVALAPLFIVIFGIDQPSKMAVVFLLAVFPVVINTATGIRSTERVYIEAARSFCASRQPIMRARSSPPLIWTLRQNKRRFRLIRAPTTRVSLRARGSPRRSGPARCPCCYRVR